MNYETAMLTPHRPHGPVASVLKWAFKNYLRAQRALGDVVAEARAEAHAMAPDMLAASDAAESGADDGMRVRWISSGAAEQRTVAELGALLDRDDGFVWIDIPSLNDAAERILTDVLGFHPQALSDCRASGHVPKVHTYVDHLFIMLQAPERGPNGQIQERELNQFIGPRYLVTINDRLGAGPAEVGHLEACAALGHIGAGHVHASTPAELSYVVITRLTGHMEALVSDLARSVAALYESVGDGRGGVSDTVIDEMFELRDALLAVETIAGQNHAICARLATLATRFAPPESQSLILDVVDQFERIRNLCQGRRELLQGILDFSRTRATTKMNRAMSLLALLSAVALPVSVIADLYGMNLLALQQPGLQILAMVLGAMALFTLGMFRLALA